MLMTPLSTIGAALVMTSRYASAIAGVAFCCANAIIAPFAFILDFIIPMWARAFGRKSALLITDVISWSN